MKIAVIGAGAAAAGVLAGIEAWARDAHVTVFDIGERLTAASPDLVEHGYRRDDLVPLYRRLRAEHGLAFPPPKSHFGETLTKFSVAGKPTLWKSEHRGGLTNVWGGGMFPLADRDLEGWPITAAELAPYYRMMAAQVGVCGEPDALDGYFGESYINRPPLRTSPVIHALRDTINRAPARPGAFRIIAGSSRLALETRPDHPHACVYSGECMLGCPREAIWSASKALDGHLARGTIAQYVVGRVRSFGDDRVRYVTPAGRIETAGPFDRIYVAAGSIASTEIVMRSLGIERGPTMLDNAVLSFPILYAGREGGGDPGYFSLCNLSMVAVPSEPGAATAQVSVYPAFDHLWRYYTPPAMWSLLEPLWQLGRWRLLLGRVFFGGAGNRGYGFELRDDELALVPHEPPDVTSTMRGFVRSLRAAVGRSFLIPPMPPSSQATSSHYASTFPYGGELLRLSRHGKLARGVHLADASTFVTAPAISPTFTIMANACRTVHESLQD